MKNRAKCKECKSIIESQCIGDEVVCKCGSIGVSGGEMLGCWAKDWNSFIRVDDEGNEIIPKIEDKPKPTFEDFTKALDEMITKIEEMPRQAMIVSINHYDFLSLLILLSSLFKLSKEK